MYMPQFQLTIDWVFVHITWWWTECFSSGWNTVCWTAALLIKAKSFHSQSYSWLLLAFSRISEYLESDKKIPLNKTKRYFVLGLIFLAKLCSVFKNFGLMAKKYDSDIYWFLCVSDSKILLSQKKSAINFSTSNSIQFSWILMLII